MVRKAVFLLTALMLAACTSAPTLTQCVGQPLTLQTKSNQEDTPETRMAAAKRYYSTVDRRKLMEETVRATVAGLPEDKRQEVLALATTHIHFDDLMTIALAALVKDFNTVELNAMANFYGSVEGKSILAKYPAYIAEVMPAMLAEVKRDVAEMQMEIQNSRGGAKTGT